IYKKLNQTETNEVEKITKIVQFKYDNLDRRIQKIFNNESYINYYYSNKDIILEENYTKPNNNGISKLKTSKYYTNGNQIDDVISMEKVDYKTRKIQEEYTNNKGKLKTRTIKEEYSETNTYYYHKNNLNSIVAITDEFGNILEEYEYDVFGKPYSIDQETGKVTNLKQSSIGNTRLFTGREYERGLKLYYNRARYYNPELGRFISRDPIDISDDVNLYSYVGNNGVNFVDPMGMSKDAIYSIFNQSREVMKSYSNLGVIDKFNKWNQLENGIYDLVYTGDKETALGNWINETGEDLISENNTIILNGNEYSLGEVSNILVGYNAYYIGYSLFTLNTGAMVYTFGDSANGGGMSNGIEGELQDRDLYEAGYNLAKEVELGGNFTMNMLLDSIKTGTYNRSVYSDNEVNELSKLKLYYGSYEQMYNLGVEINDIIDNGLIPNTY
ncbi:MAG: RHS repeat-associated core domain-containing protein, partial [Candidatus Gracilibacteria bacterium]|nr:RHS repeat-associated core domain-containing protein [Candidatus Gracilibacteria bacterium]